MHYVLTRAVYPPDLWPVEAVKRRLKIFEGITVASLKSQTVPFKWVLAVHRDDPFLEQRLEMSGATPVFVGSGEKRSVLALSAYEADWESVIVRDGPVLTTRLDDDDGFTPDALRRIQLAARRVNRRTALIFPHGFRVFDGRYSKIRHESNAMSTLYTRATDRVTVYTPRHREIRQFCAVRFVDEHPAWLWVRHEDTLSGYRAGMRPIDADLMGLFHVDWSVIPTEPQSPGVRGRVRFH